MRCGVCGGLGDHLSLIGKMCELLLNDIYHNFSAHLQSMYAEASDFNVRFRQESSTSIDVHSVIVRHDAFSILPYHESSLEFLATPSFHSTSSIILRPGGALSSSRITFSRHLGVLLQKMVFHISFFLV